MTDEELQLIFRKAAEKQLARWLPEQWDRQDYDADDLVQDLWVWYLEEPGTRRKMAKLSEPESVATAVIHSEQILSRQVLEGNTFQGRDLYSSYAVRQALKGESTNQFLYDILPLARRNLTTRNAKQAAAISSRYEDEVVPERGSAEEAGLKRAVKSLTRTVNIMHLTSEARYIGSSTAVFPETRKPRGGYSDPTGDTVVLLERNPHYRHHFYEDTPIRQFLGGAGSQPAFVLGKKDGLFVGYRRAIGGLDEHNGPGLSEGWMNIMDPVFNGMGRSEMYRAQVFPELFPHEQPMLLENWSEQDREEYCGRRTAV